MYDVNKYDELLVFLFGDDEPNHLSGMFVGQTDEVLTICNEFGNEIQIPITTIKFIEVTSTLSEEELHNRLGYDAYWSKKNA